MECARKRHQVGHEEGREVVGEGDCGFRLLASRSPSRLNPRFCHSEERSDEESENYSYLCNVFQNRKKVMNLRVLKKDIKEL